MSAITRRTRPGVDRRDPPLPRRPVRHKPALRAGALAPALPKACRPPSPRGAVPQDQTPTGAAAASRPRPSPSRRRPPAVAELGPGRNYYPHPSPGGGPPERSMPLSPRRRRPVPASLTGSMRWPRLSQYQGRDGGIRDHDAAEKADLFWTTEAIDFPTARPPTSPRSTRPCSTISSRAGCSVEDHSAAPGASLAATSSFTAWTRPSPGELTAAGFKLDAEGDLLHNPADNQAGSDSNLVTLSATVSCFG